MRKVPKMEFWHPGFGNFGIWDLGILGSRVWGFGDFFPWSVDENIPCKNWIRGRDQALDDPFFLSQPGAGGWEFPQAVLG